MWIKNEPNSYNQMTSPHPCSCINTYCTFNLLLSCVLIVFTSVKYNYNTFTKYVDFYENA